MSLKDFGWTAYFSNPFDQLGHHGSVPARVILANRGFYLVRTADSEIHCRLRGRLYREAEIDETSRPVVGDWVACFEEGDGTGLIAALLPRRTKLSRRLPGGRAAEQIVVANVDLVLLVMGLDRDFNPRRMERMLVMTYESGARPIVILNKADCVHDAEAKCLDIERLSPGVPVLVVSALDGQGIDQIAEFLRPACTLVLTGSSGVGKSTIINQLFGRTLAETAPVRLSDGRGRHTTTQRQLFRHPTGALLIDNPGIRELGLWDSAEGLDEAFDELLVLAEGCRFRDCRHESEPGCAVAEAVRSGKLAQERLDSYHKLQRELQYLEIKIDQGAQRAQKQKWRAIHKAVRQEEKLRRRQPK